MTAKALMLDKMHKAGHEHFFHCLVIKNKVMGFLVGSRSAA